MDPLNDPEIQVAL